MKKVAKWSTINEEFDDIDEDRDDIIDEDEDDESFGNSKKIQGKLPNEKESLMYSEHSASLNATSLNFAFSATKSNLAALTMQK